MCIVQRLRFGKRIDFLCNQAVGLVDAIGVQTVDFDDLPIFQHNGYHPALVNAAAVAGEEEFFFHLFVLRDAETHRSQTQPIGSYGLEIVTQQYLACGNFPGIGISVYINLGKPARENLHFFRR